MKGEQTMKRLIDYGLVALLLILAGITVYPSATELKREIHMAFEPQP